MAAITINRLEQVDDLQYEFSSLKSSIELDFVNGDYPHKQDIIRLLEVADYAITALKFEYDY